MGENDRELLELAAKAEDQKWLSYHHTKGFCCRDNTHGGLIEYYWNPLTDDGDALRLAVKLKINILHGSEMVAAERELPEEAGVVEGFKGDPYASTRRAIVRAAAEIGRNM